MKLDELVAKQGKRVSKTRGEHVFVQGDTDRNLYLVKSGLLKAYYNSDDGKEFIKSFLGPADLIASMTSAVSGDCCSFSLLSLADCQLIQLPFAKVRELSLSDIEFANIMIEQLLSFSMKKEQREYQFLCLSAEQRFQQLQQTKPELLEKVTQNDLAKYLGITPVALSRIKKRIGPSH
ncbi:Crp/Fnr family transcriptional regulator [Agaribacterium haliotis]|uniref:Crp/Fnr family transcriptional regulator n=1 Tax=Agaribacterium haliotis TaxID=2013869 RepID=UPI0013042340|nr:Crp/Fnr family transcriptional regulator [Agaribacterium haliotis]